MKKQPTLKRIAEQLGVSTTTVSRVLSGQARQYRISQATEEAVRKLAQEYNFIPNPIARGLRLSKTSTIGLIIPDISNPFFAGIARQIAQGARGHGYSVILCDSQDNVELEIQSLDLLRAQNVEGLVLCPVGQTAAHLKPFERGELPIVLVDRYFPSLALAYVASDNAAGAREATNYLVEQGHRRIACLQGLPGTSPNEDRLRGYREALATHRIAIDETLVVGNSFGEQNGYIETKLLLRAPKPFTAILALSNLIALGALRALAEEKVRVPHDVSIVSFDDQPYLAYLATPMTTVAQRHHEMGEVAVKLLFDQIRAPQPTASGGILLPTTLIHRKSVSQPKPSN